MVVLAGLIVWIVLTVLIVVKPLLLVPRSVTALVAVVHVGGVLLLPAAVGVGARARCD